MRIRDKGLVEMNRGETRIDERDSEPEDDRAEVVPDLEAQVDEDRLFLEERRGVERLEK